MYCPNWIYEISVARTALEFLSAEVTLDKMAAKYADALSEKYAPIPPELFEAQAEAMLLFLSEIEAGDTAAELLNDFCYFRLTQEGAGKPRKMKPLFGALEDPIKTQEYSAESAGKAFRAYVFALRSNTVPKALPGWMLETDENVPFLAELAAKKLTLLDVL
jgi:hypothetical protein